MTHKKAFPIISPNAAGIDISSKEHFVAVNPDLSEPIKAFGAFTEDLETLVAWLKECKVDTVAMEATGIYWVSLFLMIQEAGIDVLLVTAKHVKNVKGKKTDISDAEWIRQLHSCGLLSSGFQPDGFTRKLRTYVRHRKNLIEMSATHVRMMQKAFEQMNVKLQHVIADITGKSGREIIESILKGERDVEKLTALCDNRIRREKKESIKKSLNGIWKEEHLFELEQSYNMYKTYCASIIDCDKKIEEHLKTLVNEEELEEKKQNGKRNKNDINLGNINLATITSVDLTEIFGITDSNAIGIISEIGLDMSKWPTVKHFTSWLNLAPNNKISGGKILSSKIPKKKNRAGQVFKLAAYSIQRSNNWLSHFYKKIKSKKGTPKAIVATARKIAVIFYKMLKDKVKFEPMRNEVYEKQFKEKQINRLNKQAKALGLQLVRV